MASSGPCTKNMNMEESTLCNRKLPACSARDGKKFTEQLFPAWTLICSYRTSTGLLTHQLIYCLRTHVNYERGFAQLWCSKHQQSEILHPLSNSRFGLDSIWFIYCHATQRHTLCWRDGGPEVSPAPNCSRFFATTRLDRIKNECRTSSYHREISNLVGTNLIAWIFEVYSEAHLLKKRNTFNINAGLDCNCSCDAVCISLTLYNLWSGSTPSTN